jgi:hypothetical protein
MSGVLLVAKDVGLAAPLAMVAAELAKIGVGSASFLRGGPSEFVLNELTLYEDNHNYPDFVLTGMSSSPELSENELIALRIAQEEEIPFGVFSDTFGAWKGREWFEEYRQNATALFVLNEEEAAEARVKYPKAKVFGYGNPRWAEFFSPRMTRQEVRAKLGLAGGDIVVLVPGGKDLECNRLHFNAVISACGLGRRELGYVVVISLHPVDKNPRSEYEKLAEGDSSVMIMDNSVISADDMLPGVDAVVQSASTVGVTAACQRIPVINFFTNLALDRLEANIHSRNWPPVFQGTEVAVVEDIEVLLSKMVQCLVDYNHSSILPGMLERQMAMYPKPTGKPAAALIAEAIRDIIAKK